MYGPALPGHLGAVLTAELLNNSSHLFEFFIAFGEEVGRGAVVLDVFVVVLEQRSV